MADSKPKRSRIVLLTVASLVIGVVAWSLYGSAYHGGVARPGGLVILRWAWPLIASLAAPLAAAIVWLRMAERRVLVLENTLDTFAELEDAKRLYEAARSLAAALRLSPSASLSDTTDPTTEACYYVLDARTGVGNCAMWWCPDSKGYTCSLDEAGLYTKFQCRSMRHTDVPIQREDVQRLIVRHVRLDHLRQAGHLDDYDRHRADEARDENATILEGIRCDVEDCDDAVDAIKSIAERLGTHVGGCCGQ